MLISVKDACVLQDNSLDMRVADQIELLDELIRMEGSGEAFFGRTAITHGSGIGWWRSRGISRVSWKG